MPILSLYQCPMSAWPLMDKTKKYLKRLKDASVIVTVKQPTDWCARIILAVVPKKYDVRMCVALTKLNKSVRCGRHELPFVEYILGHLSDARILSELDAHSGVSQVPRADESSLLTTIITRIGRFFSSNCPSTFLHCRNTSRK